MNRLQDWINDWLSAWTGGDSERLLTFYHPDSFYSDPARPDGLVGREAIGRYFAKLLAQNPEWVWTLERIAKTDTGCLIKWKAQVPAGAETRVFYGMDVVDIQNDLIIRNEVYFDPSPLLKK